jgi:hypothetical protein
MSLTFGEQIQKEIARSRKMRNPSRFFYYSKISEDAVAAVSWEQFRGSWAYSVWISTHQQEIQAMIDSDNHRFPWNPWRTVDQ